MAARGSVTCRFLLVVVNTEVSTPKYAGIAPPCPRSWKVGWALSTVLWSHPPAVIFSTKK